MPAARRIGVLVLHQLPVRMPPSHEVASAGCLWPRWHTLAPTLVDARRKGTIVNWSHGMATATPASPRNLLVGHYDLVLPGTAVQEGIA